MNRIWAPLDLRGLRLYRVWQYFTNHPDWKQSFILPAKSPSHAAGIIQEIFSNADFKETPYYHGEALSVLQPEKWVKGNNSDPALDQCQHKEKGLIQAGRYAGDAGTGSENVSICLNCGIVQIFGDRNGENFEISIHIHNLEYMEAIQRWVNYVNGISNDDNLLIGVDHASAPDEGITQVKDSDGKVIITMGEMDQEIKWILGYPNFACTPIANALRKAGQKIENKSEDEQAAAIYWMLEMYQLHKANWRKAADEFFRQIYENNIGGKS